MSFCIITQSKLNLAEVSKVVFSHKFLSYLSHKLCFMCVLVCVGVTWYTSEEGGRTEDDLVDIILGELPRKINHPWIKLLFGGITLTYLYAELFISHAACMLVPRPSHCQVINHLQYAKTAYCKQSKTGRWEGLGTRLCKHNFYHKLTSMSMFPRAKKYLYVLWRQLNLALTSGPTGAHANTRLSSGKTLFKMCM